MFHFSEMIFQSIFIVFQEKFVIFEQEKVKKILVINYNKNKIKFYSYELTLNGEFKRKKNDSDNRTGGDGET